MTPAYPLTAIVGQDDLVEALLVCAVHPVVGGVLVRGERGTAKSTAVRALAPMVGGPLVDLPLGATLDRVVGSLDVRAALGGEHRVEAGLLSRADGGVLYVDEVNLLPDHLVDVLLDAAAAGSVTVERDGVSVVADARFLLVGTMNPEEGELRPQLLDRFGLGVVVAGPRDPSVRAEIVRRRMAFDADPAAFAAAYADDEAALAARLEAARALVSQVVLGERALHRITTVCADLDLDGVRGDLVCAQAARALAALDGEREVGDAHVERAAHLALRHRMRRDPLAPPPSGGDREPEIDDALDRAGDTPPDVPADEPVAQREERPRTPAAAPARLPADALTVPRRGGTLTAIDSRPAHAEDPIAALPSLLARLRGDTTPRAAVTAGHPGALLCLVIDTSGSMGAQRRLARVKGAIERALREAYARRDDVAIVTFAGEGAQTLVAPGTPLETAAAQAAQLPAGGRTPLAAGLEHAARLLETDRADRPRLAVLLTDGRAPDPEGRAHAALRRLAATADRTVVADLEEGRVRLGLAAELARAAGADLTRLITEAA
ncbi:VWA domain-containing protein [Svornostia abyssi]|uniref:VWA domain-containing protein n=1 Tax=Svornostia abyssi TaxID=2898438 RepID=A0ABY5PFE7_9ACTN|nr:VWA domain-containing protein [Parviterribacteraceae bacterium J379]